MTDQCQHCTLRGNLKACLGTPCGHHENWIAQEQASQIDALTQALQNMVGVFGTPICRRVYTTFLTEEALLKARRVLVGRIK